MKVTNNTDSALGVQGVSIPAGQSRNVKGLDLEDEKVAARLEAGDISVPDYDSRLVAPEYPSCKAVSDEDGSEEEKGEALEKADGWLSRVRS